MTRRDRHKEGPRVSDTTTVLDAPTSGASQDPTSATKPRKRTAGLSGMVLAELQSVAGELGISGTARMRKGQLIEAIKQRQDGGGSTAAPTESNQVFAYTLAIADCVQVLRLNSELKQHVAELTELKGRLEQDNAYLLDEIKAEHNNHEMVGNSPRSAAARSGT